MNSHDPMSTRRPCGTEPLTAPSEAAGCRSGEPAAHPSSEMPVPKTPAAKPATILAPDRLAFFQRIAEGNVQDGEACAVARRHLIALENRTAQAAQALALGHVGSARAFLEIARRHFDALLNALPEL